jgi:hypothetical protein
MSKRKNRSGDPRKRSNHSKVSMNETTLKGFIFVGKMFYETGRKPLTKSFSLHQNVKTIIEETKRKHGKYSFFIVCENENGQTCITLKFDLDWYNPDISISYHFSHQLNILWIHNKWIPEHEFSVENVIKEIVKNYDSWNLII